ncbi:MAG TPA: hypothetical protein DCG12_21125 [Planctomycetaceae bacterium]|nr:hypothetical protein [Planctomycetaceae bacterium]
MLSHNSQSPWFLTHLRLFLTCVAVMSAPFPGNTVRADDLPEKLADIRIEGNETIPASVILQKITVQAGRPLSIRQLREAKRNLMNTRWFYGVNERFEETERGTVLIFRVSERPIVRRVEFRGIRKMKRKELVSWTGLKVGAPFDVVANRESLHRIKREYKDRGYHFVEVNLQKGGEPTDREVIFQIEEGPLVRVRDRVFRFVTKSGKVTTPTQPWFIQRQSQDGTFGLSPSAARLKTKLQTKESWFGLLGGTYKPETLQQDVDELKAYYRGLGFFDIKIEAKTRFTKDRSGVQVVYTVNEGVPYKVRDIRVTGNYVITTKKLRRNAELNAGDFFNSIPLGKDVRGMLDQYGVRGHYFASVIPVPQFTETPGVVDIVFEIDEDRPRYVRDINIRMAGEHPHTMNTVPINQIQLEPGDLANPYLIDRGRSRMGGAGILENVQMNVVPVDPAESFAMQGDGRKFRGQSRSSGYSPSWNGLKGAPAQKPFIRSGHSIPTPGSTPSRPANPAGNSGVPRKAATVTSPAVSFIPTSAREPRTEPPGSSKILDYAVTRPENFFSRPPSALLTSALPKETQEPIVRAQSPAGNQQGGAQLDGSPYSNRIQALPPGWVDINVTAQEGRTGRLMFGAGVNSDAGVVGSFVWDERNFNLFRPPMTFADIIDGRAFRGGGQRFRLEAAPGEQVQRYVLSWTDPYFLHSDYSFGVSAFLFDRFYPDWDEGRGGLRLTLGKQLDPEWSISGSIRLEDVNIRRPRVISGTTTSVPELEAVRGNNFLSTGSITLTHDSRDSSLMPTDGHLMDLTLSHAFGDFSYPRVESEWRQYFTLHNRADGSGRHVLSMSGIVGWSGDDTPVFERFYAGGFQSFRGFAFRGVTPRGADNISIGGNWQLLGSAEYRIPLTADDMINMVVFSDVGTVTANPSIDDFRVTVGVGLRLVVPAMGPVPLAFDFGFPVRTEASDDERVFSFYVGINR